MLRSGTLGGRRGSQGECKDGDYQTQLCCPPCQGRVALHSRQQDGDCSCLLSGGLNSELGRFSVENFKSRSGCSVIRVSTSPISKELVWNQPSDSGKFAPILLAWAEQPSSPRGQSSKMLSKKERETREGNCALLPWLSSGS